MYYSIVPIYLNVHFSELFKCSNSYQKLYKIEHNIHKHNKCWQQLAAHERVHTDQSYLIFIYYHQFLPRHFVNDIFMSLQLPSFAISGQNFCTQALSNFHVKRCSYIKIVLSYVSLWNTSLGYWCATTLRLLWSRSFILKLLFHHSISLGGWWLYFNTNLKEWRLRLWKWQYKVRNIKSYLRVNTFKSKIIGKTG